MRAAPKEDAAVSSAEVVFGRQMVLPHQARMKEEASGVPEIPLRQRSYAEVAGSRPTLLEDATHVYVRRGAVGGPLENAYSGPYQVIRRERKVLLLQLGQRQEWVSVDGLKPHTGASSVALEPPQPGRQLGSTGQR